MCVEVNKLCNLARVKGNTSKSSIQSPQYLCIALMNGGKRSTTLMFGRDASNSIAALIDRVREKSTDEDRVLTVCDELSSSIATSVSEFFVGIKDLFSN